MKTILCCFLAAALVVTTVAIACAPVFPTAVFTYAYHPDFPRTAYLVGKLGVFLPTYARSYLVIAYRYLNGPALSNAERQQVREYWKDRETSAWDKTGTDWVAKWRTARKRVPGAAPLPANTATQGRYKFDAASSAFFPDCADDAYKTATETLDARVRQFGAASVAVRSWRDAQDKVFSNCDTDHAAIPEPASAALSPIIQADREYQIAAANFYAGNYTDAEARFRRIAADSNSPWNWIAPYLVVRAMSRNDDVTDEAAEKEARAVIANPSLEKLHGMTRVLLHRMILEDAGEPYFHELAHDLMSGHADASFREELWDYVTIYDKFVAYDPFERWEQTKPSIDSSIFTRDEMSDWIFNFQQTDPRARLHALERFYQIRSLPWLIAALEHSNAGDSGNDELIAAAARVAPSSPAYEIASFHRLRLLVDSGQKEASRSQLDTLLASPLTKSSRNLFRSLRMRTAPTLTDFLTFAARTPVMLTTDWNVGQVPDEGERQKPSHDLLYRDSTKILNDRAPTRVLREAALKGAFAPSVQYDFVLTAFTRALLLDDTANGLPLAEKLTEIGADKESLLAAYRDAKDPSDRRFAGVFYVLHHPEARPYLASGLGRETPPERLDDYRDNWWCPVDVTVDLDARTNWSEYGGELLRRQNPDLPSWSATFLTTADRETAKRENAKLAATGSGPDYLIAESMRYARAHPEDPRVPEALHGALRAQRYGCVTAKTAAAAEQAWRYLWRRYPKSPWTRKSNYNFESENLPTAR